MKRIRCPKCKGKGYLPDQKPLGDRLRKMRIRCRVSLREAARRMNISPIYLSHLERGKRNWNNVLIECFRKAIIQ